MINSAPGAHYVGACTYRKLINVRFVREIVNEIYYVPNRFITGRREHGEVMRAESPSRNMNICMGKVRFSWSASAPSPPERRYGNTRRMRIRAASPGYIFGSPLKNRYLIEPRTPEIGILNICYHLCPVDFADKEPLYVVAPLSNKRKRLFAGRKNF